MKNKILLFYLSTIKGDGLAFDRFRWIKKNLPKTNNQLLLDVGCGKGAFSIYASLKGYNCLGLTWDEKDKREAETNTKKLNLNNCNFEVQDVRELNKRKDLFNKFDLILCTENIEHIIDDKKLMKSMNLCLKKNGKLLLTTPSKDYIPLGKGDAGPFKEIEDGRHVRKGYFEKDLRDLCNVSNFKVLKIDFYGGYCGQKITKIYRIISKVSSKLAAITVLPLKLLLNHLDNLITEKLNWPKYSICLTAEKN